MKSLLLAIETRHSKKLSSLIQPINKPTGINEHAEKLVDMLFDNLVQIFPAANPLNRSHSDLTETQVTLNREYRELAEQYQLLRRPFSVTVDVPYTDVWTYPSVQYYPGKHPCEKPSAMMEHIINSSSREGDVVADFFMGSGATIKAALKLNRRVIGVELEADRFEQTKAEISKTSSF